MVYFRIMRIAGTILKIIILLILLAALAVAVAYSLYKDVFFEEARTRLASGLSEVTGHHVNIGSIKLVSFNSVSLDHVSIAPPDKKDMDIININNATILIDVLSFLKDKQLKTTITLEGAHSGDILCNAAIRTVSSKAGIYRKVFDVSLLESVFIIEALAAKSDFILKDIFGILKIDNGKIAEAKIHLTHNEIKYLFGFTPGKEETPGYDISLRSDNLGLRSRLTKEGDRLTVNSLTGMFYTLRFDLTGELKDLLSPVAHCSLNGTVKTDLSTFTILPGKIGDFAREHPLSGPVESTINFETEYLDLEKCELTAVMLANNLKIDDLRVKEVTAKLSLKEGRISAPAIEGALYNGMFTIDLKVDILEKELPYLISANINDMDLGLFMRDVMKEKTAISGIFNADLSLKGYANDSSTAEGNGSITISKGNLGQITILAPLIGDIYSKAQNMLGWDTLGNIEEAYMDLEIRDREIMTDDLTLWGKDIYITSEGYMDFDGNLDLTFQNHFREQDSGKDGEWRTELRDVIIRFGKTISRAHLGGTVKDPKWDFEYINPLKNFGRGFTRFLDSLGSPSRPE
ncbi:MAG: AsmA-like C-terminal region-containing protein [Candidatus Omnitrophota bacterium]|nr:AsmA-like C-terminal region-containing protein [Candidatus Omnitrophota bacterium]